ncbi:MAG: hypothetical protein CSH37_06235 [Thalassolituus sp.]|jgi:hypothetical protein|nr:MAG: hypothetical protein CSH37_06235 [Thalassolituus sp.]
MRILLSLLVLIPLLHGGNVLAEDALDEALDIDLDELGVSDDAEERLLRGNFYFSYLTGDYYRTLYYLRQWKQLIGSEGTPETEAEVMRAAVYLSLGLEDQAEDLFYQVFNQGAGASGDAWYFLAQRLFSAGYYARAEQAARNALAATPVMSSRFQQELRYLLVSSISEQDRIEEAVAAMQGMRDASIWTGYARYNLILAMQRQNYRSRDIESTVDEAIYYLPEDEEGTALRDRILLISGIAAMERDKLVMANRYFSDVTLESVFTPPALLHYGWNLLAQWRYEDAIQPWRILQQLYDEYHPAVVESYLAVPHTLELVDAVNQSVLAYERVEDRLSVMVDELKQLNQRDSLGAWLGEWRDENQQEDWGWQRQKLTDLPQSQVTRFAQGLLKEETFNQELARLHDLDRIRADLAKAQYQLGLWQDVLEQRRANLEALGGEALLDELEARQMDVLRDILAVQDRLLDEDETVFSFASKADEVRISRLRNVVPAVTTLQKIGTPTRDLAPYKERWRRMRGLQLWSIYEAQPQRKWDTERDHMILRSETDKLFRQLENTRTSLIWADSYWQGFPERVQQLKTRIVEFDVIVADLQQEQESVLTDMARDYLTELDERLTLYLAQARLALARLYDDSLQQEFGSEPVTSSAESTRDVKASTPEQTDKEAE